MTENVCVAANFAVKYYITLLALIKQQEDDTKLDLVCSITEIKSKDLSDGRNKIESSLFNPMGTKKLLININQIHYSMRLETIHDFFHLRNNTSLV